MPYGLRLVKYLLPDYHIHLYLTKAAKLVLNLEMDLNFSDKQHIYSYFATTEDHLSIHQANDWLAPIASGTGIGNSPLVVCPCSMSMVSSIANGSSNDLIERACDVAIKERKQLIIVPRETPLSAIHLENLLKLARLGVSILPPVPGFYHKPTSIDQLVDFVVARILDQLRIPHDLVTPWGCG